MIFSSNVLKRRSFQKGSHWDMIFLVLSGKMVFFTKNMMFFPWKGGKRQSFSRNSWKYNIFCVHVRVLQTWCHAPLSEKIKNIAKIHLKVIDVLYFYGGPYRRFHTPLSSEKNRKLNIPDWSLASSSIYLVGVILQWIIFNTLYDSALRDCLWKCAWAPIKEIICPLGDGL